MMKLGSAATPRSFGTALVVALAGTLASVGLVAGLVSRTSAIPDSAIQAAATASPASHEAQPVQRRKRAKLPSGKRRIFPHNRLVAYYGTAGTGVLGVLGEADPDRITKRLRRAARPFATKGRPVQPVYELIVTVADATPGPDGDYNHDISHEHVQTYIDAAHRNGALLVLDIQPGTSDFLTVAKRWKWAL